MKHPNHCERKCRRPLRAKGFTGCDQLFVLSTLPSPELPAARSTCLIHSKCPVTSGYQSSTFSALAYLFLPLGSTTFSSAKQSTQVLFLVASVVGFVFYIKGRQSSSVPLWSKGYLTNIQATVLHGCARSAGACGTLAWPAGKSCLH